MNKELEPRLTILEEGHKAIQRDLLNLSGSVKEQGVQLTSAILELSNKISSTGRVDWQTIFAFVTVSILLIAGISTPVWMNFSYVAKDIDGINQNIHDIRDFQHVSIKEQAKSLAEQNALKDRLDRIELSIDSRKSYHEKP